jgi:hypothetical protein
MFKQGTSIEMTMSYKGIKGVIIERTDSHFELYILKLDSGLNLIAGPTAFILLEKQAHKQSAHE